MTLFGSVNQFHQPVDLMSSSGRNDEISSPIVGTVHSAAIAHTMYLPIPLFVAFAIFVTSGVSSFASAAAPMSGTVVMSAVVMVSVLPASLAGCEH